jgi:hypothetical protein
MTNGRAGLYERPEDASALGQDFFRGAGNNKCLYNFQLVWLITLKHRSPPYFVVRVVWFLQKLHSLPLFDFVLM